MNHVTAHSTYKRPPILVPEQPLTFSRQLPHAGADDRVVDISIHPDLRIVIKDVATQRVLLRGCYDDHTVAWYFSGPTLHDERAWLAREVLAVLRVFTERLLDVRTWTSRPATVRTLS